MEAVRNFRQWKNVGQVTAQLRKLSYYVMYHSLLLHQRFPYTIFLFQSNHLRSPDNALENRVVIKTGLENSGGVYTLYLTSKTSFIRVINELPLIEWK